jgi:glutamate--cysteine ligase
MAPVAELLDGGSDGPRSRNLARQRDKVDDPELTPSARVLREMRENGEGFFAFADRIAEGRRAEFAARPPSPDRDRLFAEMAEASRLRQREIEDADREDFDTFLACYFAQGRAADPPAAR